ncbi:hypothetical protein WJX74_008230 [Apatococcus lobatus]|uniref:RRM domain-containing protein n=1 Tax=Apatococcus lobatus TaxID=904363 RepID=A0AAW1QHW8_9CHLO
MASAQPPAESGDKSKNKRTVFVRNIDFTVDKSALQASFEKYGPVANCFVVGQPGQRHQGYGFVQFKKFEAAEQAAKALNGSQLGKRSLQVELANRRETLEDRKRKRDESKAAPTGRSKSQKQSASNTQRQQSVPSEASAADTAQQARKDRIRAVALGGFDDASKEEVLQFARSLPGAKEVVDPISEGEIAHRKLRQDGCSGDVVYVIFASVKEAREAVPKLHRLVMPTASSSTEPKNRAKKARPAATTADAVQKAPLWARQVVGEGAYVKRWRIIIRNLPFQVRKEALLSSLEPAGFVWELHIPTSPDGKGKGFAFASFTSYADALRCVQLANQQVVSGRKVAVDWAVPTKEFAASQPKKAVPDEALVSPLPDEDVTDGKDATKFQPDAEEELPATSAPLDLAGERQRASGIIASLLNDIPAEEKDPPDAKRGRIAELAPPTAKQSQPKQDAPQAASTDFPSAARPEAKREENAAAGSVRAGQPLRLGQRPSQEVSLARTVFVRGLPVDGDRYQLQRALEVYGPLIACRVVKDKQTQKPNGQAFVEFASAPAAQAAANASALARDGQGHGIKVAGLALAVAMAVGKDDARSIAMKGVVDKHKDKRNLYLAQEGRIDEASAAWKGMTPKAQDIRRRINEDKDLKLRSPNFVVSRTRLCLHNLPVTLDEAALRQHVTTAVRERATKAHPEYKQVKILKKAAKSGKTSGPSRGVAFVEFASHDHAMAALRQMNNNPNIFGAADTPIVEFAVDSLKALQKQEARAQRVQASKSRSGGMRPAAQEQPVPSKGNQAQKPGSKGQPTVQAPSAESDRASKPKRQRPDRSGRKRKAVPPDAQARPSHSLPTGNAQPTEKPHKRQKGSVSGAPSKKPPALNMTAPSQLQQHHNSPHAKQVKPVASRLPSSKSLRGPKVTAPMRPGGRKKQREATDSVDKLKDAYLQKYFKTPAATAPQAALKKWFE